MDAVLPEAEEQRIVVRERLRLLEIGYYIRGGMTFLFASFFLLYVVMLLGISFIPDSAWENAAQPAGAAPQVQDAAPTPTATPAAMSQAPPKFLFRAMAGIFGIFVALGWMVAGVTGYVGYCIRKRRSSWCRSPRG